MGGLLVGASTIMMIVGLEPLTNCHLTRTHIMVGMAEGVVGGDGMVVFHTRDITWSHQDSEEVWSGHLCTLHQTLAGGGAPPKQGLEVEEGGEGGQRQHREVMLGGQALPQKF